MSIARAVCAVLTAVLATLEAGGAGGAEPEGDATALLRAAPPATEPAPRSAHEWAHRMHRALLGGRSMVAFGQLQTRRGARRRHAFQLRWVRAADGSAIRTLLEVSDPSTDERETTLLAAWPDGRLTQWLWLPELRRLRRMTGILATDRFLDSEFTFEDIALAPPVDRMEHILRHRAVGGRLEIEVEVGAYHSYSRVRLHLDASSGLPRRLDFYDAAGALYREQRFEKVREIGGRPFPMRIQVSDHLTGLTSLLEFEHVEFHVAVPDFATHPPTFERSMRDGRSLWSTFRAGFSGREGESIQRDDG